MPANKTKNKNKRRVKKPDTCSYDVSIPAFFTDGLLAIDDALREVFGDKLKVLGTYTVPGPFGPVEVKTRFLEIETARGATRSVPFGRYTIDDFGSVSNSIGFDDTFGCPVAVLSADLVPGSPQETVFRQLADRAKLFAKRDSIYKGQAVRMHWPDMRKGENWNYEHPVTFMDLDGVNPADLILHTAVQRQFDQAILTPIQHSMRCRDAGIPLKRGALLSGPPGVGKTMMANVIAQTARNNGWTFIYLDNVAQLANAHRFAQRYAPAVVFCEDVDRAVNGQRTSSIDQILNNLDGIDSKSAEVMPVLTTNDEKAIRPELLRPGRLDAILRVTLPDADTAERLVRSYAADVMDLGLDLGPLPSALAGKSASAIREVVERAKLACVTAGEDVWLTIERLKQAAEDVVGWSGEKPVTNGHSHTLPRTSTFDLD